MTLVSVLICTYNAEKTIKQTLLSCINQTYKEVEILILDNGSKDKTREIIGEMQKEYDCIQLYYEGKNLGAYDGLNYLLDKSKGKYIAIQDHDDIRHSKKLEEQVKFLENNNYVGCGTCTLVYYQKSRIGYLHSYSKGVADFVMHTSLMFKNEGYRYDTTMDYMCDGYFMKFILSKGKKGLYIIETPLTLHLMKEDNSNYSDYWFGLSKVKIKRFFKVYGFSIYYILIFLYLTLMKFLNRNIRRKIDMFLLKIIRGSKTKTEWEKDEYCSEMLQSF